MTEVLKSSVAFTPSSGLTNIIGRFAMRPNPLQQDGGRFVARILGDEFAPEGFGEDGLREFV
jgi:hypothetical protein